MVFRVAQREDFQPLAPWLVATGQAPHQHCLHTWSGQDAEALRDQFLAYWEASELCYVLAWQAGQLVGAMGSEFDEDLEQAWLHGPHVAADNWDGIAAALFTRLLAALPAGIRRWDAYLNVENARALRFYAQQGFEAREHRSYDFWLARDDRVTAGDKRCDLLGAKTEASFQRLFGALFPTAYYSATRIVQMMGQTHQVFVVSDGEEVLGFAVASVEDPSAGEIQFLGVREDVRRQGLGRRLLLAAIDWLLDEAGVARVCLNVNAELLHARRLYESVGFRLQFTGIGLHKAATT
jgi:GNAT superfamily N-acetyltransferase